MSNKSYFCFTKQRKFVWKSNEAAYRDNLKSADNDKFFADKGRHPEVEERGNMGHVTPYDVVCFDRQAERVARVKVSVRRHRRTQQ